MENIDIFIESKNELFEKYNKKIVSNELVNYIVKRCMYISKQKQFKLHLYVTKETEGCLELIRKGIKEEYTKSLKKEKTRNLKQAMLLIVGIIALIISTFINESSILHEIIIIAGWVPIWESIDLELFVDTEEKRKRKILKKLIGCNIKEFVKE